MFKADSLTWIGFFVFINIGMNYNIVNYLLEETLAEAYHPNYVKSTVAPKIAEKFKLEINKVMEKLKEADPSEDKRFLLFLGTSWLSKRVEDLDAISEQLFKLIELSKVKTKGSLDLLKLLENNKKTLQDLIEFNSKYKDEKVETDSFKDFKKILSEDGVDVYEIDKFKKVPGSDKHILFCDTSWCVKKEDMFDEYKPPYYLFVDSETKQKIALFHKESSQLKNKDDEPIYDWLLSSKKIEKAFYKTLEKTGSVYLWSDDFDKVKPTNELCNHAIVFNLENYKHWRRIVNNETKDIIERVNDVWDRFNETTNPYNQETLIQFIQNIPSNIIVATLTINKTFINVDFYSDGHPKNKKKYNKDIDLDFTDPKTFDKNIIKAANIFKEEYKKFEDSLPKE